MEVDWSRLELHAKIGTGRPEPVDDPREIVTPAAFAVAPDLVGTPLAGAVRRGAALLVDLALIGIVQLAGAVVFGIAAAAALFRASRPKVREGFIRRNTRRALRAAAALVLGITVTASLGFWESDDVPAEAGQGSDAYVRLGLRQLGATVGDMAALHAAENEAEARAAAERLAARLREKGLGADEAAEIRDALADPGLARAWNPHSVAALQAAFATLGAPPPDQPASADSLARDLAATLASGDTAAAERIRPQLREALAGPEIRAMQRRIRRLGEANRELADRLQEAQAGPGITAFLRNAGRDLGLSLGWAGLYFTVLLTLMHGQTPGKRLFGIRVVRLDGGPITWPVAFARFGGYAAGLSTGLLGFLQIFWDANRQGIHDRVAGTVAVRSNLPRQPWPPAPQETGTPAERDVEPAGFAGPASAPDAEAPAAAPEPGPASAPDAIAAPHAGVTTVPDAEAPASGTTPPAAPGPGRRSDGPGAETEALPEPRPGPGTVQVPGTE